MKSTQQIALEKAQELCPNDSTAVPLVQGQIYTAILETTKESIGVIQEQNKKLRDAALFVIRFYDKASATMRDDPIHAYAPAHGNWVDELREIVNV